METIKFNGRLTSEEKETHLWYDYITKTWKMESSVPKHFNKALKNGWEPIKQRVYDDGYVFSMQLTAPERAVTIRTTEKRQLSEKQLANLSKK